ncbi:MAG: MBL fold metallo-hydrolase [Nitrospirales bacterium]|nr:MBL fold metallo-hydrolase [Nitrospirales bacterium]MBA3753167.1 MBL fold metallo-hydrolase [Nitrospira sp.]
MPEPNGTAKPAGEVAPRVYRWTMHDDRIDSQSDSYAVVDDGQIVLIDPLPMGMQDLAKLGTVHSIVLTASCHERSAWRYRRQFKVPVHAPAGAVDFEADPDFWYDQGDHLAGNLIAIHSPGPTEAYYSFYLERDGGVVFCGDLLTNYVDGRLAFVPDEYQDDPGRIRESVRHLLSLQFQALCPNHGNPITSGAKDAIREALKRDADQRKT